MLNIIGDSHVHIFSEYEHARIWEIDPNMSIENLGKYSKVILGTVQQHPKEIWAFQLGDFDIKNNLIACSIKEENALEEVINRYTLRYARYIELLSSTYDVYIMSIPPQGTAGVANQEYACPRELRHVNTAKFNSSLRKTCAILGIGFMELWRLGAYGRDMVNLEYFQPDGVHIKPALATTALTHALKNMK